MKPHPKRVIWAGATLGTILGIPPESDEPAIGEALDASGLTEMPSHVSGGKDDGMALNELFEREAPELLGRPKLPKERFPLLVKRLDAKATLSVQVHPNDDLAQYLSDEPNGKSEAWYILEAKEGATVHLGFKDGISKEQVEKALHDGNLLEVMREIQVKAGDVIPVPAGCAHTIGAGIYLFEVQQPSDLTYRLDDFGRLDENKKPRKLHLTEGLASLEVDLQPNKAQAVTLQEDAGGSRVLLVDMGVFTIEKWTASNSLRVTGGSLLVVQGLTGTCTLQAAGEGDSQIIESGETLIISATVPSLELTSDEGATLIIARHS